VNGVSTHVNTFGHTVADALSAAHVTIGAHDTVIPATSNSLADGQTITVLQPHQLTVTLNGKKTTLWTMSSTVGQALQEAGISANLALSVNRSLTLGRQPLSIVGETPKTITLVAGGKSRSVDTAADTVNDLLVQLGITLNHNDQLTPSASTAVTEGMTVTVKRVTTKTEVVGASVAFTTVKTNDSSLAKGTTKVTTKGKDGVAAQTWTLTLVDGSQTGKSLTSQTVTTAPVAEQEKVGTKASVSASSVGGGSTAGLNLANEAMWDRIAQCESTGNWSINSGNGYYGGLQFNIQTWDSVGGQQFASRPDLATKAEQITVANRLYAQRGLQPWQCGSAA